MNTSNKHRSFLAQFPLQGRQCADALYQSSQDCDQLHCIANAVARRFAVDADDLFQELYRKFQHILVISSNDHAYRLAWQLARQCAIDVVRRRSWWTKNVDRPADEQDFDNLRRHLEGDGRRSLSCFEEQRKERASLEHQQERLSLLDRAGLNEQQRRLVAVLRDSGGEETQQSLGCALGIKQARVSKLLAGIRQQCSGRSR